jgi:NAD(P)-dependent dehydrogenase (short-subunit alcohol dehydrogenase family)
MSDDRRSASRSVLVTGCSSGFGRAIAHRLHDAGWTVFASARTDADLERLRDVGMVPIRLDVARSESVHTAADEVLERANGRLDALVNNAGYTHFGAVEDLTRDEIRAQFETNVFGAIELTNRFMPTFRRQAAGRIAFMSSVCGRFSMPYFGSYCASKFALEAFADALRRETRETGIRVQVIEPGSFRTEGLATTKRLFSQRSTRGPHAETARETLAYLEQSTASIPPERAALVVDVVEAFLEGRSRRPRRVVPASALVYEAAQRLLPTALQDAIVEWRGRTTRRARGKS